MFLTQHFWSFQFYFSRSSCYPSLVSVKRSTHIWQSLSDFQVYVSHNISSLLWKKPALFWSLSLPCTVPRTLSYFPSYVNIIQHMLRPQLCFHPVLMSIVLVPTLVTLAFCYSDFTFIDKTLSTNVLSTIRHYRSYKNRWLI